MAAYLLVRFAFALLALLPPSWAVSLGRALAGLYGRLDRKHLRIADINLKLAFPAMPEPDRRRIALNSYKNIGECYALMSQFPKFNRMRLEKLRRWVRYEGRETFDAVLAAGGKRLVLTGHLGLWEFMAFSQARLGRPIQFIVRPVKNRRIDALLNRFRMLSGNTAIPKREAMRAVLRALTDRQDVGILSDQDAHVKESVFVDFFGRKACMIKGPALLATRTGATVIPAFMVPDAARQARYCIHLLPPLTLQNTGDLEGDTAENTQRLAKALEDAIRRWPDSWLWFQRRWKTRPADDPDPIY